ncbi:hypothetical protein N8987_04560 [Crocinitomix sp.]|nr:hypothetical protein [Crocinitomix sp.]
MKTSSKLFILFLGICTLFACSDSNSNDEEIKPPKTSELTLEGTDFMAAELKKNQ